MYCQSLERCNSCISPCWHITLWEGGRGKNKVHTLTLTWSCLWAICWSLPFPLRSWSASPGTVSSLHLRGDSHSQSSCSKCWVVPECITCSSLSGSRSLRSSWQQRSQRERIELQHWRSSLWKGKISRVVSLGFHGKDQPLRIRPLKQLCRVDTTCLCLACSITCAPCGKRTQTPHEFQESSIGEVFTPL